MISLFWFRFSAALLWLSDAFLATTKPSMFLARWCSSQATACITRGRDAAGLPVIPWNPGDSPAPHEGSGTWGMSIRAPRTVRERRYLREIANPDAGNPQEPMSRKT